MQSYQPAKNAKNQFKRSQFGFSFTPPFEKMLSFLVDLVYQLRFVYLDKSANFLKYGPLDFNLMVNLKEIKT